MLVLFTFGFSFFSIPACSFESSLFLITWAITLLMSAFMIISLAIFYGFKVDIVTICLVGFSISSVLSSALNGFRSFSYTAPLLSLLAALIYTYVKGNRESMQLLFLSAFIGDILFLFLFCYRYRSELIGLNFTRLGEMFGDINDISIFLSLGYVLGAYYLLFRGNVLSKIVCIPVMLLFLFCAVTTGSKIFVLIFITSLIALAFLFFGKKRWWAAIVFLIIAFGASFLILQIPAFSTMRERLLNMFSWITGKSIDNVSTHDGSSEMRFHMLLAGFELFFRKPLFGWGISGFAYNGGLNNGWSHNNFSETFCNFGIVGTLLFHFGFFTSIYCSFRKPSKTKRLPVLILIFFITCMFSVALNSQKIYSFLIPLVFCSLSDELPNVLDFKKLNLKRFAKNENHTVN